MHLRSACLLIILFLTCFLTQLNAQVPGDPLKGYVLDFKSKEALPNANVRLKDTDRGVITNTEGYFIILNPPADADTLLVSYIGYR